MTRYLEYFSKFGHFKACKFAQQYKINAKVGSQFCQIVNKAYKSCPNTLRFCQSGEISPSLVTLGKKFFPSIPLSLMKLPLSSFQCDQMARLFAQFLVIYNDGNLPNCIHNLPNYIKKFCPKLNNSSTKAKDF